MKKPKSVRNDHAYGFGIMTPSGSLWPWVSGFTKPIAQDEYASMVGQRWEVLHRIGYRCVAVEVKTI